MAANLFELLNAPTSLKPKDLSTHIRMQMSLPEETRNTCSRDLFRMDIKLLNELTTCRYGRKLPKEDDPDYQAFCEAIAVKGVEPIPYRFFASEYTAIKAAGGDYRKAVGEVAEPWRMQAYAAQYLRMAQNAETGKSESAGQLWLTAIRQYRKFFAVAKVEESYTWQYAPDDDAKALCRTAWDGFIRNQLEALNDRRKEYINRQNAKAAEACLKVLSYKEVQAIVPDAYSQALKESFAPYVTAIKSAATLDKAGEMYRNCPKALQEADGDHELELAMLTAIHAELNRRKAVKEPAKDVPVWLKKLNAKQLYSTGPVMVKIEANSLYEACADYIRFALESEDQDILLCACDICAADNFPDDVFIGKSNDGDLHRPDIAPILVGHLADSMAKKSLTRLTASSASAFAKKIIPVCKKLGYDETAFAAITRTVNYMGSRNAGTEIILAFLRAFDAKTPLKDPNNPTIEALIRNIEGDPGVKLLKELTETSCTSAKYPNLVDRVLDYIKKHGDERVNGEFLSDLARKVLLNEFVGCANQYQSDQSETLLKTLKKLAEWLKYSTPVPTKGEKLTVGDVMKSVQGSPELECFKKLSNASTGSMAESTLVDEVIELARSKGSTQVQGTTIKELAQKVLLNTYVANANAYQSSGGSTSRKTMHTIAQWLPADTQLPGGGGKTVREFDDQLEPLRALNEIQDRIKNDSFTESDIACLSYFIDNWPDFDLGGKSFKDVARSFMKAMLVTCANQIQRAGSYEQYRWEDRLHALMVTMSSYSSTVSSQEMDAIIGIIKHFNISLTGSVPTYTPDFKPFGKMKRGGGSHGGGHGGGSGGGGGGGAKRVIAVLLLLVILAAAGWGIFRLISARSHRSEGGKARAIVAATATAKPTATAGREADKTAESTPAAVVEAVSASEAEPADEATPEPTPKPTPTPTKEPVPTPQAKPAGEARPEPTPKPTPALIKEAAPAPRAKPANEATPKPTAEPTPEPTAEPTPEPTAEPTPEPTPTPKPEPAMEAEAEPTVGMTSDLMPEPTADGANGAAEQTVGVTSELMLERTAKPDAGPTADAAGEADIDRVLDALGEKTYRDTYEALLAGEVLQKGSKGDTARGLQQTLIAFGQGIAADGDIGPKTLRALNDVQKAHGLETTDTLDARGYALLLSALLEAEGGRPQG